MDLSGPITLPTTYATVPSTGCIGNIVSTTLASATTIAGGSVVSFCSIALTPGVWSITGNIYYSALSGTVTTILCACASISTSAALDTQYSTRANATNFSFGILSVVGTQLNVPVTRYVALTANQTYYLVGYVTGTGSLSALTYSGISAIRIA